MMKHPKKGRRALVKELEASRFRSIWTGHKPRVLWPAASRAPKPTTKVTKAWKTLQKTGPKQLGDWRRDRNARKRARRTIRAAGGKVGT